MSRYIAYGFGAALGSIVAMFTVLIALEVLQRVMPGRRFL